jgi:hypothetical protein
MKHKINVNAEDIKKGIPGDCDACAISQALKRQFQTDEVSTKVDGGDVILEIKNKKFEVNHMQEGDVLDFIDMFDNYKDYLVLGGVDLVDPKPITFEIMEKTQ